MNWRIVHPFTSESKQFLESEQFFYIAFSVGDFGAMVAVTVLKQEEATPRNLAARSRDDFLAQDDG